METVNASYSWPGPDIDVLRLYVEPRHGFWDAEPVEANPLVIVLHQVDAQDRLTGRIAGLEIIGFSTFNRWDDIPDLPLRWQLPGDTPRALKDILMEIQRQIAMPEHATR